MMAVDRARSSDLGVAWYRLTQPVEDLAQFLHTHGYHARVDELNLLGDKFSEACQPIRDIWLSRKTH